MHDLLVIDDEEIWQDLIRDVVNFVYTCGFATTYEEAVGKIRAGNYTIICLNYNFHTVSKGRNLLLLLKDNYPDVPVVLITGAINGREREVREQCQNIYERYPNVKDILLKGTKPDQLAIALLDTVDGLRNEVAKLPSPTFSWLHLSDLHIGCKDRGQDWTRLKDALLTDLREHLQPESEREEIVKNRLAQVLYRPNAILITGDIAYHGSKKEYRSAEDFLKEIWSLTDLGREQTFTVPGNHDVNRTAAGEVFVANYEKFADPDLDNRKWVEGTQDLCKDDLFRKGVERKFHNYIDFVRRCTGIPTTTDGLHYVYPISLPTGQVVDIVGFNSALMSWRDKEDRERGLWIGPQLDELEDSFTPDAVLGIALVHHPDESIHPHDVRWTWSRIEKRCPVLLHGHLHQPKAVLKQELGRKFFVLSGGSVHNKEGLWNSQHYSYCQFDLETKDLDVYMRMATSDQPDPIYIRDNRTYPERAPLGHATISLA